MRVAECWGSCKDSNQRQSIRFPLRFSQISLQIIFFKISFNNYDKILSRQEAVQEKEKLIKDVIKDKDILQESVTSLHSRNIELKTEKIKVSFEFLIFFCYSTQRQIPSFVTVPLHLLSEVLSTFFRWVGLHVSVLVTITHFSYLLENVINRNK